MIVINCKAGVEPGTIKAWELCEKLRLPRIFFVTNMDDDKASYRELLLRLESRFGKRVAPLQLPIRENGEVCRLCQCRQDEGSPL